MKQIKQVILRKGATKPETTSAGFQPKAADGVVVRTHSTGVDGTDEEIVKRGKAIPPEGEDFIVLGHEALGVVDRGGGGLNAGDFVVPLVREGCRSCSACGAGAVDMCTTGDFQEHGIRGLHGFMREQWTEQPAQLVKVPKGLEDVAVLTEPLSIVVKAFQEAERFQRRLPWAGEHPFRRKRVLVAGSGSLGTLAALLLKGDQCDVSVLDRSGENAASSRFLKRLGAKHIDSNEQDIQDLVEDEGGFDLVIETTGAWQVAVQLHQVLEGNGVLALLGLFSSKPASTMQMNRTWSNMVMKNQIVFGSVNSNREHFEAGLAYLQNAQDIACKVVTNRYSPDDAEEAFAASSDSIIKKVIQWDAKA